MRYGSAVSHYVDETITRISQISETLGELKGKTQEKLMNFFQPTKPTQPENYQMALRSVMTKESLLQIIAQIESDPLAGCGTLTKRDLLVDRLLAHWNTVEGRMAAPTPARPILTESTISAPEQPVLELKRAMGK